MPHMPVGPLFGVQVLRRCNLTVLVLGEILPSTRDVEQTIAASEEAQDWINALLKLVRMAYFVNEVSYQCSIPARREIKAISQAEWHIYVVIGRHCAPSLHRVNNPDRIRIDVRIL